MQGLVHVCSAPGQEQGAVQGEVEGIVKQRWRCPACGWEYESPIRVIAMACPGPHKPYGQRVMQLIEGSPGDGEPVSTVPKGRKGARHG